MNVLKATLSLASTVVAVACLACCFETTHDNTFPDTCSGRVEVFYSPLHYNTCAGSIYSTSGCTSVPSTKTQYTRDFNGGPGSGCSGWNAPTVVTGSYSYTDYADRSC